jgi:F-type H+-transporting ATPase subunit gamma
MAQSPREILRRIKGIKSTQQITKAMEMVSAVKLNKVRLQAEHSRPYVESMGKIMRSLCSAAEDQSHPMFEQGEMEKLILVVITSDRGLCGTFNSNVINAVSRFCSAHENQEISFVTIGRKGHDALAKAGYNIERSHDVPWGDAIEKEVSNINGYITEAFESGRTDGVYILYSQFVNVLVQEPRAVQHLPVPKRNEDENAEESKWEVDFIVEPDFDAVAGKIIPKYLETQFYHCMVESLASEYASRMVSMRNANDNAEEVIEELTLNYNKARQASITRDLIDIIGGVEALNG